MNAERRPLIVLRSGDALRKTPFDSARQRFIRRTMDNEVITEEERFGLHDLKRRGITDAKGKRHDSRTTAGTVRRE